MKTLLEKMERVDPGFFTKNEQILRARIAYLENEMIKLMKKYDPFFGYPFDNTELILVDEAEGYKKDQVVILDKLDQKLEGIIFAIGAKAKYPDEDKEYFTAFIVKVENAYHLCTVDDITPKA